MGGRGGGGGGKGGGGGGGGTDQAKISALKAKLVSAKNSRRSVKSHELRIKWDKIVTKLNKQLSALT